MRVWRCKVPANREAGLRPLADWPLVHAARRSRDEIAREEQREQRTSVLLGLLALAAAAATAWLSRRTHLYALAAEERRAALAQAVAARTRLMRGVSHDLKNPIHAIDGHAQLFPRLLQQVARGGVLAVQMPRNFQAPSHVLLYETAARGPWAATLVPYLRPSPVAGPEAYYDWLMGYATQLDIWETEYLHVLQGENAVLEWTKGTALRPYLDALGADAPAFLADYAGRLRAAYPPQPDGRTLFPFRRVFIVAERKG